jgi:hypothetical protein
VAAVQNPTEAGEPHVPANTPQVVYQHASVAHCKRELPAVIRRLAVTNVLLRNASRLNRRTQHRSRTRHDDTSEKSVHFNLIISVKPVGNHSGHHQQYRGRDQNDEKCAE